MGVISAGKKSREKKKYEANHQALISPLIAVARPAGGRRRWKK